MSKQQRRKGNAKNASSASAHGYLFQGGSSLVGLTPEMNIFEVASNNQMHQVSEIDDNTRIVIKKLTKKDCQTREKGLKELIELINSDSTCTENCYEHFCGLVPQLSTDGSPTVRALTMKVITIFLIKLKKAATKGLKKIVPMILFAKSDVTNGVAAAATLAIRDGFDADKKLQIVQLFGPLTFEIATNIILERSELAKPAEYDASEDMDARRSRLETQSLNVFLSHAKEYESESIIWEEHARRLFASSEYIKRVFNGNKESVKVQLLSLCYKFQDSVEVMLSIPQVLPYIQNTLDAQTFTSECSIAWEGLLLLLPSEKFQAKVSLQKGLYPRILNVVRKKGNHWRVVKHYLLPTVVLLMREVKNLDSNSKVISCILESFTDNLPWHIEASINAINCWFNTFTEFVHWILSNEDLHLEISGNIIPIIIKMTEQAMIFHTAEATEVISELLQWIVENKKFDEVKTTELLNLVQSKIVEVGKGKSKLLEDAMTKSGKSIAFSGLHAFLISNPDFHDANLLKNLAHSSQDYFEATINSLNNLSFIENTEDFDLGQAKDVVQLILRIVRSKTLPFPNITVKNDHVGRQLLLTADNSIWEKMLRDAPVALFQEMINYWHDKRNGKAIAEAVSFLRSKDKNLDTNQANENVDFLISLINKIEESQSPDLEERNLLIFKLFSSLFDLDDEPSDEHFETLKNHMGADIDFADYFQKSFANNDESEIDRVLIHVSRFDKLVSLLEESSKLKTTEKILLSRRHYDFVSSKLQFLELDVFTFSHKSTLLHDAFSSPIDHLNEMEATNLVKEFGKMALFNVASSYHTTLHQIFGWKMANAVQALEKRYCLKPLDGELKYLKEEIEKRLKKSEEVQNLLLETTSSNFLIDIYETSNPQTSPLNFAGLGKSEEMNIKMDEICRTSENPVDYMERIFKMTQSNDDSNPLLHFDQSNDYQWLANIIFAKQFVLCGEQIFNVENLELRDFALCLIVSVLDNSADVLQDSNRAFEDNPRLETLTALYMELFLLLSESIKNGSQTEQTVEEWNEFYAPTISAYIIQMFRSIRKDQQPTPFVKVLAKVLFSFAEFPANVQNEDALVRQFVPELSTFSYSPFEESCISHAFSLFTSDVEHIQLIGYAVSKLLMPIMFKKENSNVLKIQDDTQVNISNRPKLVLPVMISKSYPSDHSHPHVGPMLLDLALIPLQHMDVTLTQEQRVAYCDAIDQFVKNALNGLLLNQPFEFRQTPIICRIPKLRERDYYLSSDYSATPVFFEKFASRLLFKSITLLPAAVRLFYKGMPNCFMHMFQEVVNKYASKLLIEQELSKVSEAQFEGEMKVRTVPVTGEIIAEYVIEETKMKLTIELPSDYPLSVPTLKLDKAIVKTDRAKKWLLQLNAYLFHQNGSIIEGIEMWKRNVDKGVEGVEDCTICMMTVHQQTHQLPKVRCKQCKNKFHSNCLYKWFESSNQSTCPLCRNNFT
uniref:E3 ubiquitin-protein ligase listerin n=1 Tax=Caenorhabditis tropicalis TaxID=1561998 RepID=A0A1I7UKY9_9PELO